MAIAVMLCIAGCTDTVTSDSVDRTNAQAASDPQTCSAISYDETTGVISIDPAIDAAEKRGFYMSLGSVWVEVLGHVNGRCVFEYTSEIEGGYTVYRCQVSAAATSPSIQINDGLPETSFNLDECEIVRTGNVFMDMEKWPPPGTKGPSKPMQTDDPSGRR